MRFPPGLPNPRRRGRISVRWRNRVVLANPLEDRRIDEAENVLAGMEVGCLNNLLQPSTCRNDTSSGRVVAAVEISST